MYVKKFQYELSLRQALIQNIHATTTEPHVPEYY
jgi:hypothetical protein